MTAKNLRPAPGAMPGVTSRGNPMLKKLLKKLSRIERKYETAKPIERKRLMKSAEATQKKIDAIVGN